MLHFRFTILAITACTSVLVSANHPAYAAVPFASHTPYPAVPFANGSSSPSTAGQRCLSQWQLSETESRISKQLSSGLIDSVRVGISNPGRLTYVRKYMQEMTQNMTRQVQGGLRDELQNQFQQAANCMMSCSGTGGQWDSSCQNADQLQQEMMKIAERDLLNPITDQLSKMQEELGTMSPIALPNYLRKQTTIMVDQTGSGFSKMNEDLRKFMNTTQQNCCVQPPAKDNHYNKPEGEREH